MKLDINISKKTIKILDKITIKELLELFGNDPHWMDFTIEMDTKTITIEKHFTKETVYPINPILPFSPSIPIQPIYPTVITSTNTVN